METNQELLRELLAQQKLNWKRHQSLLPLTGDIELHVLKGHLIIEEMIYGMVINYCNNSEYLEAARLSFTQLCNLARSLAVIPEDPNTWKAILLINRLRNKFAHKLQPEAVESLVNEICLLVSYRDVNKDTDEQVRILHNFEFAFSKIIGILSIYLPVNSYLGKKLQIGPEDSINIIKILRESETDLT